MQDPVYSAEAMLCAALLDEPGQYENVRWLDKDKFYNSDNRSIYVAVCWVMDHHPGIEPDEVPGYVRQLLTEYEQRTALQRLVTISGAYPVVSGLAETYAHSVHEAHQHEVLRDAVTEMARIVAMDIDLNIKTDRLDAMWTRILDDAQSKAGWQPIEGLHTVNEFMDLTDQSYDWVIPGMLERQERFMLIAPEKAGKTVLTRQVALTLASGRHPFATHIEVPVMRTLLVDLENPAGAARRDFRRQVVSMEDVWSTENRNAYILHRPAGIHLGDPLDRTMLPAGRGPATDRPALHLPDLQGVRRARPVVGGAGVRGAEAAGPAPAGLQPCDLDGAPRPVGRERRPGDAADRLDPVGQVARLSGGAHPRVRRAAVHDDGVAGDPPRRTEDGTSTTGPLIERSLMDTGMGGGGGFGLAMDYATH